MFEKIESADSNKITVIGLPRASFGHHQPTLGKEQEKDIDGFAVTWEEIKQDLDKELRIGDIQGHTSGLTPTIKDEHSKIPSSVEPYLTPEAETRMLKNEKLRTSMVEAVLNLGNSISRIEEMSVLTKQSPEDPTYVKDLIQIQVNTSSTEEYLKVRDQVHEIAIAAEEDGVTLYTHVIPKEEE